MKMLALLKDLFGNFEFKVSVKDIFEAERTKKGNDQKFFEFIIQYLGGREYNKFLDYSLLAIKMKVLLQPYWWKGFGQDNPCRNIITDLLFNDRHDLWQNMPYYLNDIHKALDEEEAFALWKNTVDAVISCINVQGTGDVSINFEIQEQ